mgnify:CR=1 FL=1
MNTSTLPEVFDQSKTKCQRQFMQDQKNKNCYVNNTKCLWDNQLPFCLTTINDRNHTSASHVPLTFSSHAETQRFEANQIKSKPKSQVSNVEAPNKNSQRVRRMEEFVELMDI